MTLTRLLLSIPLASLIGAGGELSVVDRHGRLASMIYGGDELNVRSTIAAPVTGWSRVAQLGSASSTKHTRGGEPYGTKLSWEAPFPVSDNASGIYRQTVVESGAEVGFQVSLTAQQDLAVEGVYFRIDVPRKEFLKGKARIDRGPAVTLPETRVGVRSFWTGQLRHLSFADANSNLTLSVNLSGEHAAFLQDSWERGERSYALWIEMHRGTLPKGATAALDLKLRLAGQPDESPARVTVDSGRRRYVLDGFGGNYCWDVQSPVAEYTLEHLQHAWTRTEMKLTDWEPENDNDSAGDTNWAYFESRDTPGSDLNRKFLFARRLQQQRIPHVISVWRLPEWLVADTGLRNPWGRPRNKVHPDRWDELLESIGSFLLYAKRKYGIEPEIFGFNEPNIGASILFTAEEHRDSIRRIGAHLEKLGLKTRMLLGGATGPKGTHEYVLPAAADPEAMRYVGAIGFHTWGGATPAQYAAWGDVAEWIRQPLLVTELGVDAFAFMGRTFDSYDYGMQEARQYQELLLYARPRGTMHWQFTQDYALARVPPGGDGKPVPTSRFWLIKHFTDLTPARSEALTTASSHPKVLATAFVRDEPQGAQYTFHILNSGAAREVTVDGLPAQMPSLRAVQTSESNSYVDTPVPELTNGQMKLRLPARSLTTLTTLRPSPR